jgi:hypothetical protein
VNPIEGGLADEEEGARDDVGLDHVSLDANRLGRRPAQCPVQPLTRGVAAEHPVPQRVKPPVIVRLGLERSSIFPDVAAGADSGVRPRIHEFRHAAQRVGKHACVRIEQTDVTAARETDRLVVGGSEVAIGRVADQLHARELARDHVGAAIR